MRSEKPGSTQGPFKGAAKVSNKSKTLLLFYYFFSQKCIMEYSGGYVTL